MGLTLALTGAGSMDGGPGFGSPAAAAPGATPPSSPPRPGADAGGDAPPGDALIRPPTKPTADARRENDHPLDARVALGYGALGLAALGLGVGTGLAISSDRAVDEANHLTRRDQVRHAELSAEVERDRNAMVACFGLGALLAVAGAWMLLGDDDADPTAWMGPTGAGWVVRW